MFMLSEADLISAMNNDIIKLSQLHAQKYEEKIELNARIQLLSEITGIPIPYKTNSNSVKTLLSFLLSYDNFIKLENYPEIYTVLDCNPNVQSVDDITFKEETLLYDLMDPLSDNKKSDLIWCNILMDHPEFIELSPAFNESYKWESAYHGGFKHIYRGTGNTKTSAMVRALMKAFPQFNQAMLKE